MLNNKLPKTDNCCTSLGWCEYTAIAGDYHLHFSVAPKTNLDETFTAFCHDNQEIISINGWNLSEIEQVVLEW